MIVGPVVRRIVIAIALSGLIGVTAVSHQTALDLAPVAAVKPAEAWATGIHFDFAEGVTGPLTDPTGRLTLREVTMASGQLIQMPRGEGWAIHFPARCSLDPRDCPRAILESGPAGFLNPGTRNMRWGAEVMLMSNETSDGANVLQKGLSAAGTQYKLQIDGYDARPSCVLAGEVGKYIALSPRGIADGKWHELLCERRSSWLTLYVDSQPIAELWIPPDLSIVNDSPLRLGGKGHGPYNDQFHGTMDDVFVEIA